MSVEQGGGRGAGGGSQKGGQARSVRPPRSRLALTAYPARHEGGTRPLFDLASLTLTRTSLTRRWAAHERRTRPCHAWRTRPPAFPHPASAPFSTQRTHAQRTRPQAGRRSSAGGPPPHPQPARLCPRDVPGPPARAVLRPPPSPEGGGGVSGAPPHSRPGGASPQRQGQHRRSGRLPPKSHPSEHPRPLRPGRQVPQAPPVLRRSALGCCQAARRGLGWPRRRPRRAVSRASPPGLRATLTHPPSYTHRLLSPLKPSRNCLGPKTHFPIKGEIALR